MRENDEMLFTSQRGKKIFHSTQSAYVPVVFSNAAFIAQTKDFSIYLEIIIIILTRIFQFSPSNSFEFCFSPMFSRPLVDCVVFVKCHVHFLFVLLFITDIT